MAMGSEEGRYRQFVEASADCMKELDANGVVRFVAGLGCTTLMPGAPQDMVGMRWLDLWPADAHDEISGVLARAAAGERVEFVAPRRIGDRSRWWEVMLSPVRVAGVLDHFIVISRDVTDRVELQAAIEAINELLQERLNDSVARSASVSTRYGNLMQEFASEHGARRDAESRLAGMREQLEMAARTRDLAQASARQAQKQQAIGQLVSGIAHDFNNMLQTVIVSLSGLEDSVDELDPRQQRMLNYAVDGARRATALTRRLLAFARNQPSSPEPLDAREVVTAFADFARHGMGGRVAIEVEGPDVALPVWLDRQSFDLALMNVCLNARDAMGGAGSIRIEVGERDGSAPVDGALRQPTAVRQVVVCVIDTGCGMAHDVRQRLFEPYFTTKEGGSGLGLAQVYGTVAQAGGRVEIESEPDVGTRVRLILPRDTRLAEFAGSFVQEM